MSKSDSAIQAAIQGIFKKEGHTGTGPGLVSSSQNKKSKKDIELAVAVLLVDLASCDQEFDQQEYAVIVDGMRRVFGTCAEEVKGLVNQARLALANLRGVDRFAATLRENLSSDERAKIMEIINDVIHADGVEDGFEIYLRHKFAGLLEINVKLTTE